MAPGIQKANSTRRGFFGLLLGLPFVSSLRSAHAREPRRYELLNCPIAGFQYHAGPQLIHTLHPGTELQLIPEPHNPHDKFAIRLEYQGHHLGYLPRAETRAIARLIGQSAPVQCRIKSVHRDAAPWEAVRINVFLTNEPVTMLA